MATKEKEKREKKKIPAEIPLGIQSSSSHYFFLQSLSLQHPRLSTTGRNYLAFRIVVQS
jgi:hypothetical protein